jgi:hypothetical protein
MAWRAWTVAVALGLLLGACSAKALQGPTAMPTDKVLIVPAYGPESPLPAEGIAEAIRHIGGPCGAKPNLPLGVVLVCGQAGRIAAVWVIRRGPMGTGPSVPLPEPTLPGRGEASDARVHLAGSRVWVAAACVFCRLPSQSVWIADLAWVTDEQLATMQRDAGLPAKPALRDESAWRAAMAP